MEVEGSGFQRESAHHGGAISLFWTREGITFAARDQTQLFSFTNSMAYKFYRFEFETHEVAVPGTPTGGGYDSIQLAEIELFNNFTFAGPVLTINRTTGGMTLMNGSASTLNMTGYSITSARGNFKLHDVAVDRQQLRRQQRRRRRHRYGQLDSPDCDQWP